MVFDSLEWWNPLVNGVRKTMWASCYDIPLHACLTEVFEALGRFFGVLAMIYGVLSSWKHLDRLNLLFEIDLPKPLATSRYGFRSIVTISKDVELSQMRWKKKDMGRCVADIKRCI